MQFKYSLYHYQKDILKTFEKELELWDKKIHIVAPPWSWKTIVWLEMISRIDWNHLILVPNITLQYQWKDKIEKFFLEEWENIDKIVSTNTNEIKKINILTYQSLTHSNNDNDLILEKLLNTWYLDKKSEFKNRKEFDEYIDVLKDIDLEKYETQISKYKKKLKKSNQDLVSKILSAKVLEYFNQLKDSNIQSITVDEAHHLTSWWSKVVYYLWEWLWKEKENFSKNTEENNSFIAKVLKLTNENKYKKLSTFPIIIWLTATPPYDDIDFFTLDEDYTKLLWEVDYYIPTPAIVKSARLAPWSDLVYFVEPWNDLKEVLKKTNIELDLFLSKNKEKICKYIFTHVKKNYDTMIKKSYIKLINYLKFLKNYSEINISEYYFDENIDKEISLEDIAKTVWKYLTHLETRKVAKNNIIFIEKTKKLFYKLWYIRRSNNFYKFRTQIENMLVYSKSKINWIKVILDKEIVNLWKKLKCAIITDFLEDKEWIINCKYILKNLTKYKSLNPILVSWQGIWKLSSKWELEELDTNILEVTRNLEEWKTNLLIWTRWILGEWWDCPKLNTLIDLTWIIAYMSVNQVRGRAIRRDKTNEKKVANIYDIVTYYPWYTKDVDFYRLKRKHEKFYWVDDTWLIIRWINHIYPNIEEHFSNYKQINENMLKRSSLRDYYYKLWKIWWNYENKEVFWLDLEITELWRFIPFVNFWIWNSFSFFKMLKWENKVSDLIKNSFYRELIKKFLNDFLTNIIKTMKTTWELSNDFSYKLVNWNNWNFKLISNYKNELMVKKFILDISKIFSVVTTQKYVLEYPFTYYDWEKIIFKIVNFWLPDSLSKNSEYRWIFKNNLENDFLSSNSLVNIWKIVDKSIKTWFSISSFWIFFNSPFLLLPLVWEEAILFLFLLSDFIGIWLWWYWLINLRKKTFFKKRDLLIEQYKNAYNNFKYKKYIYWYRFKYLQSKKLKKQDYIWQKPFIKANIEKVWI